MSILLSLGVEPVDKAAVIRLYGAAVVGPVATERGPRP